MQDRFYSLIKYVSFSFLLYILILCVFVKTPQIFNVPSFLIIATIGAGVLLIMGILWLINFSKRYKLHISSNTVLISIIAITFLVRLIWVLLVNTAPVSDFVMYYNYAVNASKGIFNIFDSTYPLFPFKFGYPLLLAIFYKIFGISIIAAKMLNVIVSTIIVYVLYKSAEMIFDKRVAAITGIIFALWPSQIMYNSVLASEHLFTLFLIVCLYMFLKAKRTGKLIPAMNILGMDVGKCRMPLVDMSEKNEEFLRKALNDYGLLS